MDQENVQPEGQANEGEVTGTESKRDTSQDTDGMPPGVDENGNLTPEGMAALGMYTGEDTPTSEPSKDDEGATAPKPKESEHTPKQPDTNTQQPTSKRKIKWQGQDVEIEPDRETEFIQKGFDYTQKMQALAAERDLLTPHVGLVKAIQSDPSLMKKVAEHLQGAKGETQPEVKKQFDDPIEQLKWEIKQETLAEARKEIQQGIVPLHRQQAINQVKAQVQADPDYAVVHQKILDMVKALPPALQKSTYLQLDQDTNAYLEAFATYKAELKNNNTSATHTAPNKPPEPVKRDSKAPLVETPGSSSPAVDSDTATTNEIKALNKRVRNGDSKALGRLLLLSGQMKGIVD